MGIGGGMARSTGAQEIASTVSTSERAYALDGDCNAVAVAPALPQGDSWIEHFQSEKVGEELRINRLDFTPKRDENLIIAGPPTLSISLLFKGAGRVSVESGQYLDLASDMVVLFHSPHETRGSNQVRGDQHVLCLDFRFAPDFVSRLGIPALAPLIRAFTLNCSVQDTLLLGRPMNAALRQIGRDVLNCSLAGIARQVYLQAKALELFAHIVALIDHTSRRPDFLIRSDREKVSRASTLLTERFSEPWTIMSLARAVGLNDRKLKSGFRQIVGQTVHGALENARLEAAALMLEDETQSITDVALAIGYANPSHFAKLFKRRHGAAPQAWRRR
jgi:AraC-like DNA-binding protein